MLSLGFCAYPDELHHLLNNFCRRPLHSLLTSEGVIPRAFVCVCVCQGRIPRVSAMTLIQPEVVM
jgi:hypothetical protein